MCSFVHVKLSAKNLRYFHKHLTTEDKFDELREKKMI